ncbi:DoxX family protein [Methylobacterium sp. P31]
MRIADRVRNTTAAILAGASSASTWAPLPIRLIVGYGFMEHGLAKAMRGLDAFPSILHAMGVPAPYVMGALTIVVEILGGFCILIVALVPLASIPMIIVLLTAMFTVHWQYGFSSIKLQAITPTGAQFGAPGFETDLLYLTGLATLVLGGSGPFSLDRYLARLVSGPASSRVGLEHDKRVAAAQVSTRS